MNKHIFTVYANSDDIRMIENGLVKYFRKAFNAVLKREYSDKKELTLSVTMWQVDKNGFEFILASACKYGLKGTNLMYRENWYIDIE